MKRIIQKYFKIPLVYRLLISFVLGGLIGICCYACLSPKHLEIVLKIAKPFGSILTSLLKMIVVPIIFFSLVVGASTLTLKKSGKLGSSVMLWYFVSSLFATVFGIAMAYALNPSLDKEVAIQTGAEQVETANKMLQDISGDNITKFITNMFVNPFQALATNNFLAIVLFAIMFGLATRVLLDQEQLDLKIRTSIESMVNLFDAMQRISFKMIEWIMEYFPIGVLALTLSCFAENGPMLLETYLSIAGCVIIGVIAMIILVYPIAIFIFCRKNPYKVMNCIKNPIITAFVTRSSIATLPVSMKNAEELKIDPKLFSFSLPLGATINMDGVCVHLPVFAILAANMYGMTLSFSQLVVLVISVVFVSVGVGGIPGGSLLLLFMVLENLGLSADQSAPIVALALGINPLLDMFETSCNVAGDNVCTYIIAQKHGYQLY